MSGLRRRKWKHARWRHARRVKSRFLGVLLAALCFVLLLAGTWVFLRRDDVLPRILAGRPAPPPQSSIQRGRTTERTFPFDGLDPVASPDFFDVIDAQEAAWARSSDMMLPHWRNALDVAAATPASLRARRSDAMRAESRVILVIEKDRHQLTVFSGDGPIKSYRVAVGRNRGNKQSVGDLRTPEGVFTVYKVHDARHWAHDFGDGKGMIAGAYGPLFIRLETPPWKGIGVHGTHDDASLGTDATEGCIRMQNDELLELAAMIDAGTTVIVK